jgi:Arc/MetJ family transcription regulator
MSTNVDNVDESTLEEAQKILGTSTKKDTVNAALREVVRQKLVLEFVGYMKSRSVEELEEDRKSAWRA